MADIVLDHVGKTYSDGSLAVEDVNLEIADGEFVILVGPSGCGKSTTLNMIAGLEDISTGELRIDGKRVNEKAPKDRDIAMVFQSYALYPHMSVRENIAFPLKLAGLAKDRIAAKVEDAARTLDLTDHLDRRPGQLSGGQRQRVAMGRAIVRSPKAFLMDEPLSNLDAKLRVQMRAEVSRLQRRLGTTMVYVTHDQTEAMTLGDRVVVLRSGRVQQVGAPQQLYDKPANLFVAGFIGSPAMNFVTGRLTGFGIDTAMGEVLLLDAPDLAQRAAAAGNTSGEVIVGIRPEHFEDARLLDLGAKLGGLTFTTTVDVLESLGSDKFVHFDLGGATVRAAALDDAAAAAGMEPARGSDIVARLSADSTAALGQSVELFYDPRKIAVFDPATGVNLTA
jgi:multiple sugar transport system ATP-binding protein